MFEQVSHWQSIPRVQISPHQHHLLTVSMFRDSAIRSCYTVALRVAARQEPISALSGSLSGSRALQLMEWEAGNCKNMTYG